MVSSNNLGDIKYYIDHDARIIYAERHDNLTKERVYAEWQAIQQLEGFDPAYETIVDYSLVPCVELDVTDIIQINKDLAEYDPRTGNVAIISGITYGRLLLARFFCTAANLIYERKHQVFQTRAEAEAWLSSLAQESLPVA